LLAAKKISNINNTGFVDESLFARIAQDIEQRGFSIMPTSLPEALSDTLFQHQQSMEAEKFKNAGIGRGNDYLQNEFVRTDAISWITGETPAGKAWLEWTTHLQHFLNRRLFLGLFSFESHFAHYRPGAYYKRHYDAFKGESNRVLSVVAYFNSHWLPSDGGELVLYKDDHDKEGIKVIPLLGTIVVFLSEEFPHEVLAANRDRYSIAGWFRINGSVSDRVDPPL
jgi:SM-20-related protein